MGECATTPDSHLQINVHHEIAEKLIFLYLLQTSLEAMEHNSEHDSEHNTPQPVPPQRNLPAGVTISRWGHRISDDYSPVQRQQMMEMARFLLD